MKPKITVIGSANTDMIVQVPRIPGPGETVIGGRFTTAAGGKGANQAVAAARAGGDVTCVARVGDDSFGREAIRGYEKDGIRTSLIARDPDEPTGIAQIWVAENGENSIAVALGANNKLSPDDVERAKEEIKSSALVLLQLEMPLETVRYTIETCAGLGIPVVLNPAPAAEVPTDLYPKISFLTPNEHEAALLCGFDVCTIADAERAAKALAALGAETVIITLGEKGSFLYGENDKGHFPAFSVSAVDTTAAGDVFNGALVVALGEGQPLDRAVRFASAASALSVQMLGAQPSIPVRADIDRFLSAHAKDVQHNH